MLKPIIELNQYSNVDKIIHHFLCRNDDGNFDNDIIVEREREREKEGEKLD